VRNRVVQRAILDVLQRDPRITVLLRTKHSFGGIEGRGIVHAMREVAKAVSAGHVHYYRSDIRDFFTAIPQPAGCRVNSDQRSSLDPSCAKSRRCQPLNLSAA